MLHLVTEDVEAVLTMDECLDALRTAHDDFGCGDAAYSPRCDILDETGMPESRKSTESRRSL